MKFPSAMAAILLLALVFAVTAAKHFFLSMTPDNAIHVFAAQIILDKGSLYPWFFETNPPLFPYLTILPVLLADGLGVSAFFSYRLMTYLAGAVCLCLAARELARIEGYAGRMQTLAILTFWAVLLVGLQASDFGQRDHLVGILALPYVVNLAARFERQGERSLPISVALLIALGIAIKPHYIGIWVFCELALMIRARDYRVVFNHGNVAVVLTGVLYIFAALIQEPYFFSDILPMLRETYSANSSPLESWMVFSWLGIGVTQIIALRIHLKIADEVARSARVSLSVAFLVASQGAFFGFALQAHFPYQLWPFIILFTGPLVLLLLPVKRQVLVGEHAGLWQHVGPVAVIALAFLVAIGVTPPWIWQEVGSLSEDGYDPAQVRQENFPFLQRQIDMIDRYAGSGSYYVFSTNGSYVFPVVHYAKAGWPFRFHTLWPLPAIAIEEAQGTKRKSQALEAVAVRVMQDVTHDILTHRPELVLVDTSAQKTFFPVDEDGISSFDYLEFFSRSRAFREAFSDYVACGSFRPVSKLKFDIYVKGSRAALHPELCPQEIAQSGGVR